MNFKDLPISRKLMVLFVPITLIPFILFASLSYIVYRNYLITEIVRITNDQTIILNQEIEGALSTVEDASNNLALQLNGIFDEYEDSSASNREFELDILQALFSTELSFSAIESVAFLDAGLNVYASNAKMLNKQELINTSLVMKYARQSVGNSIWIDVNKRDYLVTDDGLYFTLVKKVIDLEVGYTLGYIVMNVSEDYVSDILETDYAHFVLLEDDEVISSNKKEELFEELEFEYIVGEPQIELELFGAEQVIVSNEILENNWTIVGNIYLESLNESIMNILMLIMYSSLAIIVLVLLVSMRVSRFVVNPINHLKESVERIGNKNFDEPITGIESKDEIGMFAQNFDQMRLEIKHLLEEVEVKEKEKREYELNLMFEQLKPHFLYNTLDTIAALTEMNRKKQSLKAIKQLASFYRKTLSSGQELISIYDEIEVIENYLYIQQLQYSDQFDFKIETVDGLDEYLIPKLTLQPIVENAIYHGLKQSHEFGKIILNVWDDEGFIYLTVHDNGVGFDKEMMEAINTKDYQLLGGHFGVRCIVDRLRLYFDDSASYTVRSEEGYTLSIIKIPKRSRYDDSFNNS